VYSKGFQYVFINQLSFSYNLLAQELSLGGRVLSLTDCNATVLGFYKDADTEQRPAGKRSWA